MDLGWIAFGALAALNATFTLAWKPFLSAYMGEKGKRLATREDVDAVLRELRLVTTETEAIKAQISGDLWLRQAHWNQKRDLYAKLFESTDQLWEFYQSHLRLMGHGTDMVFEDAGKIEAVNEEISVASTKLVGLATLSIIFLNQEAQDALQQYEQESNTSLRLFRDPWTRSRELKEHLTRLKISLIAAAKQDLGLQRDSNGVQSNTPSKAEPGDNPNTP